jgi:acetyl/propionyl-CoA carboxylase alpha subunit
LQTAVKHECDALHPGIGFLSESPTLARLCKANSVAFVGPSAGALELCGDKNRARQTAESTGLKVVPGTLVASVSHARAAFEAIAGPGGGGAVLKAVSGGGGKGIRHIGSVQQFDEAFERAASEADRAFGDSRLLLERYVSSARHIEVQLLADKHGNVAHLGEDPVICSTLRSCVTVAEDRLV